MKPQNGDALRLVFLVGYDNRNTRRRIQELSSLPGVTPVAVLLDAQWAGRRERVHNLKRNIRREGWSYVPRRIVSALRCWTDHLVAEAATPRAEVLGLWREAFPGQSCCLHELGQRLGIPVHCVSNLNSAEAIHILTECRADLGVVLGTRILKRTTFSIPRLGCINLHKGFGAKYRGTPPGFWELFDGAKSAGVTVHFIDDGLDTGDIVASSQIPVSPMDTPETLPERLTSEGARVLAEAVRSVRDGAFVRQHQNDRSVKPRRRPTRAEFNALCRKLPHWKVQSELYVLRKNLYSLFCFYSGLYSLARFLHRRSGSRAAILAYHRVSDDFTDILSLDTESLAAQLLAVSKRYHRSSTKELISALREGRPIPPTSVAIHFDDSYRDIAVNAAPLLKAGGWTATAFLNSGFVSTDRRYPHDDLFPFTYANLSREEVREWAEAGFEVGAHTVNHADLGACDIEQSRVEITECGRALEEMTGKRVEWFAYPFGEPAHIRPDTAQCIREAGYTALFGAHGGFIGPKTDLYDIPRIAIVNTCRPLYLLLELEGMAPNQVAARLRRFFGRRENALESSGWYIKPAGA